MSQRAHEGLGDRLPLECRPPRRPQVREMRLSRLPLNTLKETPADAEIVSHQLMLRAGLIRRLSSGLFSWMPVGLRVLRKVENIIREEMDRSGALEILMPAVQPAELWKETGRWEQYGSLLLRMRDRHDREWCFGPTHEEVVTDIARRELKSYRQLPVTWYQIQTKFRDEIRPRFGVMRAREFLMKDAYSFHLDQQSLEVTYDNMEDTYTRIFERMGLQFRAVEADSGEIGGSRSQEFHVLADSGEDAIAWCEGDQFAANVEMAPALAPEGNRPPPGEEMQRVPTPDQKTIKDVAEFLGTSPDSCIKTLLVAGSNGGMVALVLRGDHELNTLKAERLPQVARPLRMAVAEEVADTEKTTAGFIGPVDLVDIPVIADHAALAMSDFVCGANTENHHLTGVNWERDLPLPEAADLRNVVDGDASPGGGGKLQIVRGIEVGHIFQLGDKYSSAMRAAVLDQDGKERTMTMGCYGIGVSRIVAAAIEQNHDDNGIIWPEPISPWQVTLLALGAKDSVLNTCESLYQALTDSGLDVLFDDRDIRPGVKFADADLLGIPHRLVVGERGVKKGVVEYRHRRETEASEIPVSEAAAFLLDQQTR